MLEFQNARIPRSLCRLEEGRVLLRTTNEDEHSLSIPAVSEDPEHKRPRKSTRKIGTQGILPLPQVVQVCLSVDEMPSHSFVVSSLLSNPS